MLWRFKQISYKVFKLYWKLELKNKTLFNIINYIWVFSAIKTVKKHHHLSPLAPLWPLGLCVWIDILVWFLIMTWSRLGNNSPQFPWRCDTCNTDTSWLNICAVFFFIGCCSPIRCLRRPVTQRLQAPPPGKLRPQDKASNSHRWLLVVYRQRSKPNENDLCLLCYCIWQTHFSDFD